MRTRPLLLLLLVLLILPAATQAAPAVLATIKPVHSLVAGVMEGVGQPALLIGGGLSEHSYALKPSDAAKIAGAEVVFWIGPDLETTLIGPLANLAGDARVVALEEAPGLRRLMARPAGLWEGKPPASGPINPHIWLDPQNAIAMTRAIAAALSAADPADAARYGANARRQIARLTALDRQLARRLAPVRTRPFVVFHDAYPYFDTRYGLDAIGAVTVEPDRPVGPRRVAQLHDALKSGKAICIFREPQFAPALITALADGTRARVGVLDPLGADLPPGPGLYPALMEQMARALVQCLAQRAP
ncbi:MAG: zinc ABC transporter substrate-binding protein [Pseudomonadota bacterium]|nr:zinc ABC transporter substrate-binding protein [Pseudomonadota bacterium]